MAYSKNKYTSRRERKKKIDRNTRIMLIAIITVFLLVILFNRVYIWDIIRTSFY